MHKTKETGPGTDADQEKAGQGARERRYRAWSPLLLAFGLIALAAAAVYYILCRDFLGKLVPEWAGLGLGPCPGCAVLGFLPSLLHSFAFVLLCSSLFPASKGAAKLFALFWVAANLASELVQGLRGFRFGQDRIQGWDVLLGGVFDYQDVIAALAGALSAYILFMHQFKTRGGIDARHQHL